MVKKDAEKSSIPLKMLLTNKKSLETLGLLMDDFPSVSDFFNEVPLSLEYDYSRMNSCSLFAIILVWSQKILMLENFTKVTLFAKK